MSFHLDTNDAKYKKLLRAIKSNVFNFIIIQHDYYPITDNFQESLSTKFPEKKVIILDLEQATYREIIDGIKTVKNGIILLRNFQTILDNEELYVSLNQRRDTLAKQNVSILAFIPNTTQYLRKCAFNIPDLWAFNVLVLNYKISISKTKTQTFINKDGSFKLKTLDSNFFALENITLKTLNRNIFPLESIPVKDLSSIGGLTAESKEKALQNIREQIKKTVPIPSNYSLLLNYYKQTIQIAIDLDDIEQGLLLSNQLINLINDNEPKSVKEMVSALSNRAKLFLIDQNYQKAISDYKNAKKLIHKYNYKKNRYLLPLIHLNLSIVYSSQKKYKKAIEECKRALKKANEITDKYSDLQLQIYQEFVALYTKTNDIRNALKYNKEILFLATNQNNHLLIYQSYQNNAILLFEQKHYQKAIEHAESAIKYALDNIGKSFPGIYISYLVIGHFYFTQKDLSKTVHYYEKAQIYTETYLNNKSSFALLVYYELAEVFFQQEKYEKALNNYNKILEVKPKDIDSLHKVGIIYTDYLNEPNKGIDIFKKILELNPKNTTAIYNLGIAYNKLKQYEKTIVFLSEKEKEIPYNSEILCLLGNSYQYKDIPNNALAIQYYKKSLRINPSEINASINLAYLYFKEEKYEQALPIMLRLEKMPNQELSRSSLINIGKIYNKSEQPNVALKYLKKALESQENHQTYCAMAESCLILEQYEKSILFSQKALNFENEDNCQKPFIYIGKSFEQTKKFEDAIDFFKSSATKYQSFHIFWTQYGWILYKSGKYKESINASKKAIEIKKDTFMAHNNLALALFANKQVNTSIEIYDKVIQLASDKDQIDISIEDLKTFIEENNIAVEQYQYILTKLEQRKKTL